MNGLPQHVGEDQSTTQADAVTAATAASIEIGNDIFKKSHEKVQYWLSYKFILPNHATSDGTIISDSESLSSPTSLFFVPNNPFDPTCDNSTQQLLDSETLGNETEEKLVLCNPNDNQLNELLQILKENEKQNSEINALRLERERIELEEAKIRLNLAEEEASRMNNNDSNNCHLQILGV
uniref:Uncharacterized protein n=1 Tax=Panagrolaimus superbus TaxID=310955 RepID=A0A914XVP7_9BILA